MLARTWRGATDAGNAQKYVEYLTITGFAAFRATPGNVGAIGLRRIRDGKAEFMLVSLWESETAIKAFAGTGDDTAVFFPEDDIFLVDRDPHVDHFQVVYADLPQRGGWFRRALAGWFNAWRAATPAEHPRWNFAAFR